MKKTILAIGAHPDDIEIGCGGTLSLLKKRGYELFYLIVTSGEEGNISSSKTLTAATREKEALKAAQILGASEVFFLREPDGLTTFSKETKMNVIALLRTLQPEIVFTHAKSDLFCDHKIVYELSRAAILAAGGPWYPSAGMPSHQTKEVYGYEVWNPIQEVQMVFDISSVIEQKIEALSAHASQIKEVDYSEAVKGLAKYRGVMTMSGQYAEVFEVIKTGGPQ